MTSRLSGLLLGVFLLFSACTVQPPDCASPQVFCAGLVTTTEGLHDHAFSQAVWENLQLLVSTGLLQHIAFIESLDSRDYSKNMDVFALDGYDVIITVGMGMRAETLQAAHLYPNSVFIGVDQAGDGSSPNLLLVTFPEDQAGFLAGALAARLTRSGRVGAVCETSGIDANWKTCEGFRNGAGYIDPKVRVDIRYRDDGSSEKLFVDTAWGQETGRKVVNSGADVLFGVGGGTGQGALLAAMDAQVYAIGSERDQYFAMPQARPVLLTSVVKQAGPRVYELVAAVCRGDASGGVYPGQVLVAPYRGLETSISPEIRQEIAALSQALADGSLRTNVPVKFPR